MFTSAPYVTSVGAGQRLLSGSASVKGDTMYTLCAPMPIHAPTARSSSRSHPFLVGALAIVLGCSTPDSPESTAYGGVVFTYPVDGQRDVPLARAYSSRSRHRIAADARPAPSSVPMARSKSRPG